MNGKPIGWRYEPGRHALAARGIPTTGGRTTTWKDYTSSEKVAMRTAIPSLDKGRDIWNFFIRNVSKRNPRENDVLKFVDMVEDFEREHKDVMDRAVGGHAITDQLVNAKKFIIQIHGTSGRREVADVGELRRMGKTAVKYIDWMESIYNQDWETERVRKHELERML